MQAWVMEGRDDLFGIIGAAVANNPILEILDGLV